MTSVVKEIHRYTKSRRTLGKLLCESGSYREYLDLTKINIAPSASKATAG